MDRHPRISDLIPRSYLTYGLFFLANLAIIAGLEALYHFMPLVAGSTTDGRVAAFDLDGEGNLASWYSSMLLTTAAALSLVIYSIRRHKLDDFQGRYCLWLWAAGCWMLMSMDESGSLHEGFKELMTLLTGQRIMGDGSIWWVGAYLLLLGTVSVRVLLDIRRSKVATAAFLSMGLCFVTAVAAQMQLIMPETGARGVMLEEGCEMLGYVLLVISLALFARHVIFDASGALGKERSESREAKAKSAAAATATTAKRDDLAGTSKSGATAATPSAAQPKSLAEEYEELYDEDDDRARGGRRSRQVRIDGEESVGERRKLSKADRKAMRREKERYRRGE